MERKLYEFFDGETMPGDCAQRIEAALKPQSVPTGRNVVRFRRKLIAAAVLVCLSILTVSGISMSREGQNLPTESIRLNTRNAYWKLFGLEIRSRAEIEDQKAEDEAWDERWRQAFETSGELAEVRDGRLYFIACGENIDITDLCSDDTVFLYTYTDKKGYLHYIGIGGTPERWGHSEVLFDTKNPNSPSDGWCGGSGSGHWNNEADEPYGWYVQFQELTGHPYPF